MADTELDGRVGPGEPATEAERAEYFENMAEWYRQREIEWFGDADDENTED